MSPEEFLKRIEWGLGRPVTFDARPHLARLRESRGDRVSLRYEWIKNPLFFRWTLESDEVDIGDGQEWLTIWIRRDSSQAAGGV